MSETEADNFWSTNTDPFHVEHYSLEYYMVLIFFFCEVVNALIIYCEVSGSRMAGDIHISELCAREVKKQLSVT